MKNFNIGTTFTIEEYGLAYNWIDTQEADLTIVEIEPKENGTRRFQIVEVEQSKNLLTEELFNANFFEVPKVDGVFNGGYYRRHPKGYQSAVESINTVDSICTKLNGLPINTLTFYSKPDFTKEEECTEEWLVANQFKNEAMSVEQFSQFYVAFITAWNTQEHK
jgi:hypothetical protein